MANILILDDEECLLQMAALILRRKGHTTVACATAESAMQQFEVLNGRCDLLIADVSLGSNSGVEIGSELYGASSRLKILFISGYPLAAWSIRDAALFSGLPPHSVRLLRKPFSPLELRLTVEELIGQSSEAVRTFGKAG